MLPFVALIVIDNTFFPYVFGKNVAFRVIIEIIFSAWLLLAIINEKYRPRWTLVLVSVTAFVGITAIADFLGENFFKSFWSNYERMDGLITLLHILAYMMVAQSVMVGEKAWLWFWRISLGVSALISIHVLLQSFSNESTRLYSTLGNPIYLAVYSLFHIFIALILAFRDEVSKYERYLYFLPIPFLLYGVYLTSTRGATLGILIGILLSMAGIAFSYRKKRIVFGIAVALVALLLVTSVGFWMVKDSTIIRENNLLNRFATISLEDPSIFARTIVWNMAITGIKEKPLLGWGQENFNYVFNFNYDPRMYGMEPWYDRTHNFVFDWAISSGGLGLLAYISIYLALLLLVYRTTHFNGVQKWLLLGLLTAYTFQNLTVFDQVISYILFFSTAAWIVAVSDDVWERRESREHKERDRLSKWLVCIIVPVAVLLIFSVNGKAVQANMLILDGLRSAAWANEYADKGDVATANQLAMSSLEALTKAAAMDTYGTQEANEQIAFTSRQFAGRSWVDERVANAWYMSAVRGMMFEKERAPRDARFPVFLADVHASFGQLEEEQKELIRARTLSPQKQSIILKLANNALGRSAVEESVKLAGEAYQLDKSYSLAALFYAIALIENGDVEKFEALYKNTPDLGLQGAVLNSLIRKKEFSIANRIWKMSFLEQGSIKNAFVLGAAYNQAGYEQMAIESIQLAITLNPDVKNEGERILKTISP
tara:strand:- start:5363 stop:7501 length:2139 start_codon:yes stop_codon:yes gene_type:complete